MYKSLYKKSLFVNATSTSTTWFIPSAKLASVLYNIHELDLGDIS